MTSDRTRWSVIQEAAEGRPEARAEFARHYEPVIRAYLGARWRSSLLLEMLPDATQQVFIECFKAGGALRGVDRAREGGFGAYLYGITRNVARSFERAQRQTRERQPTSSMDLAQVPSTEDSFAGVFDRAWAASVLRDAAALQLARARERGAEAVRRHSLLALRYGENLPIREIAARWNVPAETLHREYPKAREEFRRALMDTVRDLQGGSTEALAAACRRLLEHLG